MILICTLADLPSQHSGSPRSMFDLNEDARHAASWAEDVYFWSDGEVKALKRRNHPLVVPDWLLDRENVDT